MKVLLAGTPNFSVDTFTQIINNFEVVGLIAQPNKPVGRKLVITEPATIKLAKSKNIKTFQPNKILDVYDELKTLDFDVLITMAYGQIIPKKVLELAKINSFNIHASLLPKYRGAAPIQHSLLNNDQETGITFMVMNEKMDEGDIVFQEILQIEKEDNQDDLLNKLSDLSSKFIVEWLKKIKINSYTQIPQDNSKATYAPKISKDDEFLKFDTIEKTLNKIRALSSNPGAYLFFNSQQKKFNSMKNLRLKVFKVSKEFVKNAPEIKCVDGILYATEYQFEGRRRVII